MVAPEGPSPVSLSDPTTEGRVLMQPGFADVTFAEVDEPVFYGSDVAAALDWVRGFTSTSRVLERLDTVAAARAIDHLRETLATHEGGDGVWFDSRGWIVSAGLR